MKQRNDPVQTAKEYSVKVLSCENITVKTWAVDSKTVQLSEQMAFVCFIFFEAFINTFTKYARTECKATNKVHVKDCLTDTQNLTKEMSVIGKTNDLN